MSHHTNSGSGDERHDYGAQHQHRHHHHGHARHDHQREWHRPGPHVEARTSGSPQEIAGYLDELADAIRGGGVTIRTGERAVGLRLNGQVALDLRAAAGDGGTSRLDLSMSWHAPQPPAPPAPKLRISTLQAPESSGGPSGPSGGEQQQQQSPSEGATPSSEGPF